MSTGSTASIGVWRLQRRCRGVTRNEPQKSLPPDFVIALTTPPVKRPYSAEIAATDVVVSSIASSMKRLFGVPRMLSWMLTPFTVNEVVERLARRRSCVARRGLVETPGARRTAERSVRVTGSFFVRSC